MNTSERKKVFHKLNLSKNDILKDHVIFNRLFDKLSNVFNLLFSSCHEKDIFIKCMDLDNFYFDENSKIFYVYENKYLTYEDIGISYESIINIKPYSIELNSDEYSEDDQEFLSSEYIVGEKSLASVDIFSNFMSCNLLVKNYLDDTFSNFFIKNGVTIYYMDNDIPMWIKYLIISCKAYQSHQYQMAFSMGYISFDSFITLVNEKYCKDKRKRLTYHERMKQIDKILGNRNKDNNWCNQFDEYRKCRNDLLHGNKLKVNIDHHYYEVFLLEFYDFMIDIYNL